MEYLKDSEMLLNFPKLSVTGSLNPITWLKDGLPKLNVKWNADGGIFKQPTIFNTNAGMQGVGEAGAEAIMPLSKLESMLNLNQNEIDYKRLAKEMKLAMSGMVVVLDDEPVGSFPLIIGRWHSLKGGIV